MMPKTLAVRYGSSLPMAIALAALLAHAAVAPPVTGAAAACDSLATLALPAVTVTSAQVVAAGAFPAPAGRGGRGSAQLEEAVKNLPAFCRVEATLKPSADSDIKIEVWMPVADGASTEGRGSRWNGKFQAVGNGGWTGSIAYPAMIEALGRGYATSSTDTGHVGGSASFALGHPEKLIDFGYRSVHEMTVVAKKMLAAYYGNGPRWSYWNGCSAGGRQGLQEAQRFANDFEGIIAGAPAADWTGRAAQSLRVSQALHKDEASYIPPAKYSLIHNAVLEACDARDGVKDGVLENPRLCKFDPKALECKGADDSSCLTPPQVEAARQVYASAVNPRSKREIAGLEPGSELGWATWGGPQPFVTSTDHFKFVVFKNPGWDPRSFSFDTDIALADQTDGSVINALNPDLKAFFGRGGKLLQYHGWSDPQISPGNSVTYYKSVVETSGGAGKIHDSYRLFMVPGMAHCRGGEGPDTFDSVGALEQWVEEGKPPDQLVASRTRDGRADRTRPLCPYPQAATYKGSGSPDEAASFVCK